MLHGGTWLWFHTQPLRKGKMLGSDPRTLEHGNLPNWLLLPWWLWKNCMTLGWDLGTLDFEGSQVSGKE